MSWAQSCTACSRSWNTYFPSSWATPPCLSRDGLQAAQGLAGGSRRAGRLAAPPRKFQGSHQIVLCMLSRSVAQSLPTLCDPGGSGLPGVSVQGIFPATSWRGLPRPPPGDLPDPGIKPASPVSCIANGFSTTEPLGNHFKPVVLPRMAIRIL